MAADPTFANGSVTRGAFTLTEILVVTAILMILTALALAVIANVRTSSAYVVCTSNLSQIVRATELYRADADGQIPRENPGGSLVYGAQGAKFYVPDILKPYGTSVKLYDCPALSDPAWQLPSDYVFRFVLDYSEFNGNRGWSWRVDPYPTTVLGWDWNHLQRKDRIQSSDTVLFVRADGSVARTKKGALRKSFWRSDGTWSFEPGRGPEPPWQFVFPGEEWPPGMIEQTKL